MEMIKVKSSNINAIGYDGKNLLVEYASGIYMYKDVDKKLFEDLQKAESKGRFMNAQIKGKYPYFKLESTEPCNIWRQQIEK